MVKNLVVFLVIMLFSVSLISFQKQAIRKKETDSEMIVSQARPTQMPISKLTFSDYWVDWTLIKNLKSVELKTNLQEKLSSEEAKEKYSCDQLISGGFYSQEGKHIGLFIEEYRQKSSFQESSTFNSFFSLDEDNKAEISYSQPSSVRLGVQAGPMLLKNGEIVDLRLKSDSNSRRIVLAIDSEGFLIFVAIYNKDSFFLGPELLEVPELLKMFGEVKKVEIVDAMNLDGGSHSAFLSGDVKLTELSTIGSFFCITE